MKSHSSVIVLCGPTASGKSELAVWLAEQLQGEIISADSQQVYCEMNIGTGKPTVELLQRVSHFGFDLVTSQESFHEAEFQRYADEKIAQIQARSHVPLVVGGTGLYLRVLQYGLSEAPARDVALRTQLLARIAKEGSQAIFQALQAQDPVYAARIHPHDVTRMIRAMEILHAGQMPSCVFAQHTAQTACYSMIKIGLQWDRAVLYARINQRVEQMLEAGWLAEVRALLAKYGENLQAYKAVGYRELIQHLRGEITLEAAKAMIQQRTRNYAKRQLTWFRQDAEIRWFEPQDKEKILAVILNKVKDLSACT